MNRYAMDVNCELGMRGKPMMFSGLDFGSFTTLINTAVKPDENDPGHFIYDEDRINVGSYQVDFKITDKTGQKHDVTCVFFVGHPNLRHNNTELNLNYGPRYLKIMENMHLEDRLTDGAKQAIKKLEMMYPDYKTVKKVAQWARKDDNKTQRENWQDKISDSQAFHVLTDPKDPSKRSLLVYKLDSEKKKITIQEINYPKLAAVGQTNFLDKEISVERPSEKKMFKARIPVKPAKLKTAASRTQTDTTTVVRKGKSKVG